MATKILIEAGGLTVRAELNDGETSRAVIEALPITGSVNRWGEEIYFEIPVKKGLEEGARADVEVGEIGYWPTGRAFCIFFGPTPASSSDKPRAASAVTILGRTLDDAKMLTAVRDGEPIVLKKP